MKDYIDMEYHPAAEKLVNILCSRTRKNSPLFFRVMTGYYFSLVASMMRCTVHPEDKTELPVNMYAINLAGTGFGKGHAQSMIEEEIISQFRGNWENVALPTAGAANVPIIANIRAKRRGTDPDLEITAAENELESLGHFPFQYDSGTAPAIKDLRHRILLSNLGSMNLTVDEIGTNLQAVAEALAPYLELFDKGKLKQKLTKNTPDNKRKEEIHGWAGANLLAFGTPDQLFDGSKTEELFYSLLMTGYARRCFFGYGRENDTYANPTPLEVYNSRVDQGSHGFIKSLSDQLGRLADPVHANKRMTMQQDVALFFIEYELDCERRMQSYSRYEELAKAELKHRHFKSLKLAAAYAFVDGVQEVSMAHAESAVKLAEDSGKAFQTIMVRERNHEKLANYLADINRAVTQADLVEDLPFYRGSAAAKDDMFKLAVAHGYQNSIVIKKTHADGIDWIKGETLKKTDQQQMVVSHSKEMGYNYVAETAPFDALHILTQAKGYQWCTHGFKDGHRNEDNAVPGFNMIVLDVDGTINMPTARALLSDYRALFYTTKSCTAALDYFRIIIPINYYLELDAKDYKEFMSAVFEWLPFSVDTCTGQRSRTWASHSGQYEYQDGVELDALPFIPKTSKNEALKTRLKDQQSLDNLERWFLNDAEGNGRNNMLLKYALVLVDAGFDLNNVQSRVMSLNEKLPEPIPEARILQTIMITVGKRYAA
jgi:hypothetical protein